MSTIDLPRDVLEKIFDLLSPAQLPGVALVCRFGNIIINYKNSFIDIKELVPGNPGFQVLEL